METDYFIVKGVKHVKTPAGAKKYGLPIGAIIVADKDKHIPNFDKIPNGFKGDWHNIDDVYDHLLQNDYEGSDYTKAGKIKLAWQQGKVKEPTALLTIQNLAANHEGTYKKLEADKPKPELKPPPNFKGEWTSFTDLGDYVKTKGGEKAQNKLWIDTSELNNEEALPVYQQFVIDAYNKNQPKTDSVKVPAPDDFQKYMDTYGGSWSSPVDLQLFIEGHANSTPEDKAKVQNYKKLSDYSVKIQALQALAAEVAGRKKKSPNSPDIPAPFEGYGDWESKQDVLDFINQYGGKDAKNAAVQIDQNNSYSDATKLGSLQYIASAIGNGGVLPTASKPKYAGSESSMTEMDAFIVQHGTPAQRTLGTTTYAAWQNAFLQDKHLYSKNMLDIVREIEGKSPESKTPESLPKPEGIPVDYWDDSYALLEYINLAGTSEQHSQGADLYSELVAIYDHNKAKLKKIEMQKLAIKIYTDLEEKKKKWPKKTNSAKPKDLNVEWDNQAELIAFIYMHGDAKTKKEMDDILVRSGVEQWDASTNLDVLQNLALKVPVLPKKPPVPAAKFDFSTFHPYVPTAGSITDAWAWVQHYGNKKQKDTFEGLLGGKPSDFEGDDYSWRSYRKAGMQKIIDEINFEESKRAKKLDIPKDFPKNVYTDWGSLVDVKGYIHDNGTSEQKYAAEVIWKRVEYEGDLGEIAGLSLLQEIASQVTNKYAKYKNLLMPEVHEDGSITMTKSTPKKILAMAQNAVGAWKSESQSWRKMIGWILTNKSDINEWDSGYSDWLQYSDKRQKTTALLKAFVAMRETQDRVMYRGLNIQGMSFDEVTALYTRGKEIWLSPQGFSSDESTANGRMGGPGIMFRYTVLPGAKMMPIYDFEGDSSYNDEQEHISGGRFRVVALRLHQTAEMYKKAPTIEVVLEMLKEIEEPDAGWDADSTVYDPPLIYKELMEKMFTDKQGRVWYDGDESGWGPVGNPNQDPEVEVIRQEREKNRRIEAAKQQLAEDGRIKVHKRHG